MSHPKRPWIIAHRGASGHAPENTIAAFRRAVELGASFIETDLHLTRDAHFVAIHDTTLDRTTNGRGLVRNMTLAELRRLDAGWWFDRKFAGERIPTLEEILAFAREADVTFYLEIKSESTWGMHNTLVGALRSTQEAARTLVVSFDPKTLEDLRGFDPALMTGLLIEQVNSGAVRTAQAVGARQLCPRYDRITPELIVQARRADLQVATWTVNEPRHMRAVLSAGVDGVMTDFPDRLRSFLSKADAEF